MSDTPPLNTSNVLSLSVHPEPAAKAFWTPEDESALINHLIDRKAEAGDGANFKGDVWKGVAKEMEGYTTKGGVKTAAACKSKWTRLKESYNVVTTLKNLSGYTWDDEKGMNAGLEDSAWKAYTQAHPKAVAFSNKGFRHYEDMFLIIPSLAKGTHVFRATNQLRGVSNASVACADNTADNPSYIQPSAAAGQTGTSANEIDLTSDGPNDPPPPFSPLCPLTTVSVSASASASTSTSASSKRKFSALDSLGSASLKSSSTYGSGSGSLEKRLWPTGPAALNGLKESLDDFTTVFRAGLMQTAGPVTRDRADTSPERKRKAIDRLQECKTDLNDDRLIALIDLFKTDADAADTYVALKRESTRKAWVRKQLREVLGFPNDL